MKKISKLKGLFLALLISVIASNVFLVNVEAAGEEFVLILDPAGNTSYGQGPLFTSTVDGQQYKTIRVTDSISGDTNDIIPSNFYIRKASAGGDNSNDVMTFCIEPLIFTEHREPYDPFSGELDTILSNNDRMNLQMLSYFGYGYNGDFSQLSYIATQVAIRQARGTTVSNITQDVLDQAAVIHQRVTDYKNLAKPSFLAQNIALNGYGKENGVTLTDTNNVFSTWFNGASTGSFNIERTGEEVLVYATKGTTSLTGTLQFQNINPTIETARGVDIVYTSPNDKQKLMKVSGLDFSKANMSVRLSKGTALINKQDIANSNELAGATLQVVEKGTGTLIESWVSDGTQHSITNLVAGEYILQETASPDGYTIAEDMPFTISTDGQVVSTTMKNDHTKIEINKFEEVNGTNTTNRVVGARLQVIDKATGLVVHDFTTTDKSEQLNKMLVVNKSYILHEVSAPSGYTVSSDIEFTVSNTSNVQKVTMFDGIQRAAAPMKAANNKASTSGVNTGDTSRVNELLLLCGFSLLVVVYFKVSKQ